MYIRKMRTKLLYPVVETLLFKINFSKPFLRTFVTSCISNSWDSSDDERLSRTIRTHNRSWDSDDEGSPRNKPRYSQTPNRSWDSDDEGQYGSRPQYSQRPSYNDRFRDQDSQRNDRFRDQDSQRNDRFRDQDSQRSSYNDRFRDQDFQRNFRFSNRDMMAGQNLRKPDWNNQNLLPIEKDFFTHIHKNDHQTEEEVAEFRNANAMTLSGKDVPHPITQFMDYPFSAEISRYLSTKEFETPTPIQSQGIPIALSGRDMVGIAKTGSGKTLGYILPGLTHIHHQARLESTDGPVALVLAPTRELVQQINQVAHEVGRFTGTRSVCVFGGASKNMQARQLYNAPSLCIATPGRLLDFLESEVTNLRRCSFLVVDEADRMLDMGFEPQIRKIVEQTRPDRQTLMWSATWPRDVQNLARDFLSSPVQLNVGSLDLVANPDIEQEVEVLDSNEKMYRLIEKLESELQNNDGKVLIFVETKRTADWLCNRLYRRNMEANSLHGDISQNRRDFIMGAFRKGSCSVLVATDVASRGLDVDGISLVVNYDFPKTIDSYIHRIGRTARAGKSGKAFSFITQDDYGIVGELTRVLREANQEVPEELAGLSNFRMSSSSRPGKKRFRGPSRW